jgi:hypothetical protein
VSILKEITNHVKKLIELKKEGVYWDFKQEHHKNNIDLIHDIICLANANHDGDRYLIFGVSDDFNTIGVEAKKQADIITLLRDAKFADDIFPDILLEHIEINNKNIDILVIKNKHYKPYYLIKQKEKEGKSIQAGTIYTRVMDTNTPKNGVASSKDIEYMWKERFGLIQTPLGRMKLYLNNFKGWKHYGEDSFYIQYPEFTIKPLDENHCKGCEKREWARGEIGYHYDTGNGTSIFGLYYHTTLLSKICCVQFDGGKKYIVNPNWEAVGAGRIYFYLEDSMEYAFQKYLTQERKCNDSKGLRYDDKLFDIPVFKNKNELKDFMQYAKNRLNIQNDLMDPMDNEDEQDKLFQELINLYCKWERK